MERYQSVFLFHFLPGPKKKVQFGTRGLPGANIHKPHRTGYREFALGGIKDILDKIIFDYLCQIITSSTF